MNNNYMIYPLKNMRITCRYDEYSHTKHNVNVIDGNVDYPIDDGGKDTGKDPIYCPCDEMIVTAIRGIGNSSVTNTIWLVSTSQVVTPTFIDYAFMTLTHSDDDDIKNIKVGDKFKRGQVICHEGSNGTTNNHVHMACGRGSSNNWKENSNGGWVMTGNTKKPEDVFYIDKSFTNILYDGKLKWTILNMKNKVGNPVTRDITKYQVEVLVDNLNARSSYSTESDSLGYINKGIYDILETINNEGYLWVKVETYWIAINDEWNIIYEIKEEPKLIFECKKNGKYIIYLKNGMKLYLRK